MPELTSATGYFEVFDMVSSVAFYRDLFGFQVIFASPEVETREGRFSHYVRLRRDRIEVMLNTAYDSNERPPDRCEPRWGATRYVRLYIDCDDVMGLYDEATGRGLKIEPPTTTGYGLLAFSVSDPDGYALTFHQPR